MIAALELIPARLWAALSLIGALGAALVYQSLELAQARTEHALYVARVEQAARAALDAARAQEQRRQRHINEVRDDAQDRIKAALDDAALAASTADSLQRQVDRLLAGRRTCDTRVAQGSAAIGDLTRVLAELRRRADERAGELARTADASRIAGQACERAYDSLRSVSR
jgi:chromosome segregation ATPase